MINLNLDRCIRASINGIRLVFGGAAGGVGYRVVTTDNPLIRELGLFFVLILMTGIIEYLLLSVEKEAEGDK